MNTLRIWGGGLFFYDAFYDACDELGLLILHDLMFIEQVNTDRLQIIRCFSLDCVLSHRWRCGAGPRPVLPLLRRRVGVVQRRPRLQRIVHMRGRGRGDAEGGAAAPAAPALSPPVHRRL